MSTAQILAPLERTAPHVSLRAGHRHVTAPGTERKLATVLFVDVEGSMALSGSVEVEEWFSAMDELFELLCEGVYAHGGWVASFTGDGIMAVFDGCADGAGGHARQACQAALWMHEAVAGRGAELWREHGLELSVRTGMHSGEILVGTIGHSHDRHYTPAGYTVALAKRIEGLARAGRAWLSEGTASLVGETMALCDRGAFPVKGAPEPVRVFELLGGQA